MRKVLLLNASGEVLSIITWHRALKLVFKGKVRVCESYEGDEIRSARQTHKAPSVVMLLNYIFIPFERRVPLNKKNLLVRDGGECQYCGRNLSPHTATIDHVIPSSQGGDNTWRNTVVACKPCNNAKADKTPAKAGMALRNKPFTPTREVFLVTIAEKPEYTGWMPYLATAQGGA